ncbi:MAG: DNA cytosine methyltransferase [Clostridiales bacterium]|nr:DNA cytosine methyltransferase [Clostridiales bacterium]
MYKVAGFFSGVGGIELGFKKAGFNIVWANEYDERASITYKNNFNHTFIEKDIRELENDDIPNVDVITAGFPCQAFSIAGYRKGFEDKRGNLFFEVIRLIRDKKPRVLFFENVKNLVSHDKGNTYKVILETLEAHGYYVKDKVLNGANYGNVPQNRERIYIVAFLNKEDYEKFSFPKPIKLTTQLSDVIKFDLKVDEKYFYTKDKNKFYDQLEESITSQKTVYQWRRKYVRENKSGLCPTLTANMGTGGHNVPLIKSDYGIRKLTPRECFNLQGYPEDFILPDLADSHLYKQAGNSVVVPVIEAIAKEILKALNGEIDLDVINTELPEQLSFNL